MNAEQEILQELKNIREELAAMREHYDIARITFYENIAPNAIVGVDYAAYRFGCSESAVVRGRFDTDKIPRFRQKPLKFKKSDVDATFKQLTRPTAERAAEFRHKAKKNTNRRTTNGKT